MQDALLNAAMTVLARDGWRGATLRAVAEAAPCPLAEIVSRYGDFYGLLDAISEQATLTALKEADAAGGSQAIRDRLFEVLMARLDALQEHRPGIKALLPEQARDPLLAAWFAVKAPRQMARIAAAAGVRTHGLRGLLRVQGLTFLYLRVARIWLDDETEDLAKTLKALDQALAQAERWAHRLDRMAPPAKPGETPA